MKNETIIIVSSNPHKMDWKVLLFCFIGSIAATSNSGWRENTQYEYDVESRTLSGHPDVGNQFSGIILKSVLTIIVRSDGTLVGQLYNTKYAKIHINLPEGPRSRIPHEKLKFNKLKMSSSTFEMEVKNGVVKQTRFHKDVPNWEVNIIKSIISQVQLDTRGENLINGSSNNVPEIDSYSGSYKTMEESILGKIEVLHEINQLTELQYQSDDWLVPYPDLKGQGEIMEVVKTKNFNNSEKHVGYHHGLSNAEYRYPWSNRMGDFLSRFSGSRAIISGKLDKYTIQSVTTNNEVFFSPAHNGDQKMMVFSEYKLSLSKISVNTRPPPPLGEDEHVTVKSLMYEYIKELENTKNSGESGELPIVGNHRLTRENADPVQVPFQPISIGYMGESIKTVPRANLTGIVITIAKDIKNDMKHPGTIPHKQTLSKVLKMQQVMRLLSVSELNSIARELYVNDENVAHKNNAWLVYLEGLAETGTAAALKAIEKLVLERKVKHEEGAALISQMVKSVRNPNYRYMRMFYTFSTHPTVQADDSISVAATLAFASLVGNVLVDSEHSHSHYPIYVHGRYDTPEGKRFVTDEYIPYLSAELDKAIEKDDNKKAQVIIYAFERVRHPKMLAVYEKYLDGKIAVSHFLRTQMVFSLWQMAIIFPEVAQPVLNKIYSNSGEHTDVRVAALQSLAVTTPSASMLQKIAIYSIFDSNKQVNAAVDSMIRTLSEISINAEELQANARSALHLLPKRRYGFQHSHVNFVQYFPDSMTFFDTVLHRIGGFDTLYGNSLQNKIYVNGGRIEQEIAGLQFITNTAEAFAKALLNKTKENNENEYENNSKWSSEKVRRNLKIKPNILESPEANLLISASGIERFYSFDVHSLNNWAEYVEQIKESIREGNNVHVTKILNQNNFYMGFPAETGFPAWISSENPLLINVEGRVWGAIEPKEKYRVDKAKLNSTLRFVISKKMQDRIGFVAPFEHQHYVSGHDMNAQAFLPLKINLGTDIVKNRHEITLQLPTNEKRVQVVQFSTVPYTAQNNILKLAPLLLEPNTHIINAEPKSQLNTMIGKESTGMAWRVHIACEDRILSSSKLMNALGDHSVASSIYMHLFYGYIHNSKLELDYDAEQSVNHEVYIGAAYDEVDQEADKGIRRVNLEQDNEDIAAVAKKLFQTSEENIEEEVKMQTSRSLENPSQYLVQGTVWFCGREVKTSILYKSLLAIAKDESEQNQHAVLYLLKKDTKSLYKGIALVDSHTLSSNIIDPFYALSHPPTSKQQAKFVWGTDYASAMKFNASIDMERSEARTQYLQNSQIAHDCNTEFYSANVLLEGCSHLHKNSNLLDEVKVRLQYKNVWPRFQNVTNKILNYAKCAMKLNMEENKVNATGSGTNNAINIKVNFHEEFDRVNVSAKTSGRDMRFDNIKVSPAMSSAIFAVDATNNVFDRMLSHVFASQRYKASCSVDQSAVNTFDNKTYQSKQKEWTVMFMYVPNQVNKAINMHHSMRQDSSQYDKQNEEEYMILTRKMNSEVKITLRTPQTHNRQIDIDMIKTEDEGFSRVIVVVNQQRFANNIRRVIEVANGYIKIKILPHGEVLVDIKNTLSIAFDGFRIRVMAPYNNKFVNKVRGLCGNYDSDDSNDLYAPETCVYNNVKQFVTSYQPYQNKHHTEPNTMCSYREITFSNVISKGDFEANNCVIYRKISAEVDGQVCVSIKPQRVCKPGCIASQEIREKVLADCSNKGVSEEDNSSEERIKSGWSKNLRQVIMSLPQNCSR